MLNNCSIIIPTYYPGEIINNLLNSLPEAKEIIILDNSDDINLKKLIIDRYKNIKYINTGDIGLGKTFNMALEIAKSNQIFLTQPDVILRKNCLENLLLAKKKYKDAAVLAPLLFEKNNYSIYDHLDLALDKKKRITHRSNANRIYKFPSGDFCVEAINSTALLIDKKKITTVKGWDDYFYTYLEDIDLCLRLRKKNLEIIKVFESQVDHVGFGSHQKENEDNANENRIFNFCRSSIYFNFKHRSKIFFTQRTILEILKILLKIILNSILFRRKKIKENFLRIKAYNSFFLEKFAKK
mgnify:FL=1